MPMALHYFVAIVLTATSLASAQYSALTTPIRRFSNPVQPTAFPNDPALTTPRPLVILTPSESDLDDVESASNLLLIVEGTTVPFQDIDSFETIPFISSPSSTSPSSLPSASFASSTSFVSSTPTALANHAERRVASSSSPSPTTSTGTHATKPSSTSNPASVPTAFANAAVGLIAIVGLAMAL